MSSSTSKNRKKDSFVDSDDTDSSEDSSVVNNSDEDEETHETSKKNSLVDYSAMSASANGSSLDIPATDDEEDSDTNADQIGHRRKVKTNRITDSDSDESDEEDKLRKSMYQAESDEEDHQPPLEDEAFSKATRRSIHGFLPRKSIPFKAESSDDDSDVIIEESEDETEEKSSPKKISSSSDLKKPVSSSFVRSPLNEISNTKRSMVSNDSFDKSIGYKMSSTIFPKEESLLDEAAGGAELMKVSQVQYNEAVFEKESLEKQARTLINLLESQKLPDGGEKLKKRIRILSDQIEDKTRLINMMEVDENKSIKSEIARSFEAEKSSPIINIDDSSDNVIPVYKKINDVKPVHFGKVGMENFENQKALTVDKLVDIQQQIDERPMETTLAKPPKYLKLELMPHQLHAIEFMTWREKLTPRGGILADDMGLGKTLTTISLIMKSIQATEEDGEDSSSGEDDDEDGGWKARGQRALKPGGTLIVCPASLLKQWEAEIKSKVKGGALTSYLFHGANREYKPRKLAQHDIVITTYQVAVMEEKNNGCLFQVKWKRIVLDEGHIIRNHKSKQSEAVCKLESKYRWVLSGTPIQNKEFDLFAAVKFLKCRPFDELRFWKQWVEVKGQEVSPRVQALLKSIMLRRTKQQLIESGEIESLPNKVFQQFNVTLTQNERSVYNKFMCFSQALFANFMVQQQDKNDNFTYEKQKVGQLFKKFAQKHNVRHDVKAHEILTTILRLRQICCHPGLAKNSIESFDVEGGEDLDGANISEANESYDGVLKHLEQLNINGSENENGTLTHQHSADDDVFNMEMESSKLKLMMEVLRKHVLEGSDKCIIVSQWTGYLNVIRGMLEEEGVTFCELNGTVPVKFRNDIVVNFNKPHSGIKVMLLSLTAGGVGLNLVGANYLFLMDLHWNPQLEQQAQDRIYRFGQTKQVNVFKFVCIDTIEEQILKLQQKKMDAANSALTGAKKAAGSKLTVDDLKTLFGMNN